MIIEERRFIPAMLIASSENTKQPIIDAFREAKTALLEKAVLANAEGWQSGKIQEKLWADHLKLGDNIALWMEMTRHESEAEG